MRKRRRRKGRDARRGERGRFEEANHTEREKETPRSDLGVVRFKSTNGPVPPPAVVGRSSVDQSVERMVPPEVRHSMPRRMRVAIEVLT